MDKLTKETIKKEIKQILIENRLYVGNDEAAALLRELAAEWAD